MTDAFSSVEIDFKSKRYSEALSKLDDLIRNPAYKTQLEDLYYKKALCLYFLAEYPEAYEIATQLDENPKSRALMDALNKKKKSAHRSKEKNERVVDDDGVVKKLPFFKSDTTFKDVIGLDAEKKYLNDNFILLIKEPKLAKEYGKRLGDGLILYSAPGQGKTLLARAICGESGANMLIMKKQDILNMYVGNGEKNLHMIFEQARKNLPCIIFIDEIDAITNKRADPGDSKGEGSAMVNLASQLLEEMDGIEKNPDGLFIIGATNLPYKIDSAFKRGGRFGTMKYIRPPKFNERVALFQYYMRNLKKGLINYNRLALATTGYAAGDISNIADKSTLAAMIDKKERGIDRLITTQDAINVIKRDYPRSSLDEWYINMQRTLLGTIKTQIIDGREQQSWEDGTLQLGERDQYREMIQDIVENTKPLNIRLKYLARQLGTI